MKKVVISIITFNNNQGIAFAREQDADFIMLLNNDTTVRESLLLELIDGLGKKENAGVAVPKIYFSKGSEFHKDRYTEKELGNVLWYAGGDIDWNHIQSRHQGMDEVD